VLCLLLAQGLRRRLSAAWMLTTILLLVGALLSLLKGFDWEEAC
jgi:phosphatidylglycerol lysyltransferase